MNALLASAFGARRQCLHRLLQQQTVAELSQRWAAFSSRSKAQPFPWGPKPGLKLLRPEILASSMADRLAGDDRDVTVKALVTALDRNDRIFLAHALAKAEAERNSPRPEDPVMWRETVGSMMEMSIEETGMPLHMHPSQHTMEETVLPPSSNALWLLAISHGIPFVGFGFLDNFIMITAGESIEAALGATLTISSMCAAGLGNLISDIAGLSLQEVIAKHSHRFAKEPELTAAQEALPITQRVRTAGAIIGISIGCIVGMCPLIVI
mmetsp:Transcript_40473/g.114627  ORF Transcript_40473/g.114627 Transcript_40473/m.114627 type:complete len:267 (-) Transcript_40473:146-946(-)|eukprot:CAMPEP_0117674664 /NCGR_PEP_ID=MMETSP0804-20121206/15162_1 /TAXON_ID=1074897 /ORGANISM="Tetraselmis astigmatica, Strain CCMP880" /LENGTH=266 /DNA_ID=CAMNT_0005483555 /DNA_START=55 /DNA_END=855 /DNA_ORIENTATION=-